jgi:Ser/Thr protein kinase RdoA (MazF antagonist)
VSEERLSGGFVNEVWRVGSTVRRSTGPWTPAVHALLRHLEAARFAEAPRALGVDDRGREVLTYLEGTVLDWTGWPDVMLAGDGVAQLGDLLRRYHAAVRDFRPPDDARWRSPLASRAPGPGELVRHGDFSPFNTVWRGDRVVGLIDWDFAQPGAAISDVAYLAWYAVPLAGDRRAREYGFADGVDRSRRLRELCAAYGRHEPADVVEEAVRIIELERVETLELARRGVEPWARFAVDGNPAAFASEAAWIRDNRRLLLG